MDSEKLNKLKAQFEKYYKAAMEAREKDDFYKLVENLNKAGQCQLDMAEVSPIPEKLDHVERGKKLKETADAWKKMHPEAFQKVESVGGGGEGAKYHPVESGGTTFNDIVGCDDLKAFIKKQYIQRFDSRYEVVFSGGRGGNLERGMLLFGLPGTGKTMLARAIASETSATFFHVKSSELVDSLVGNTEKNISALYEEAAKYPVSIVFIDEIETLIPNRSMDIKSHEASAVTEFLRVLDGFEKEKTANVITIGASNYPGRIDPAAIRPGRLGAWFRVDLPAKELRKQLIQKNFKEGYTLDDNALRLLAKETRKFSAADVVAICDRIKSELADNGIAAVDRGASEAEVLRACGGVTEAVVKSVLAKSNSSVSNASVLELATFENNFNFKCPAGDIRSFMENID